MNIGNNVTLDAEQSNYFSLSVYPGADIPLGPLDSNGQMIYTLGGSANLSGQLTLPFVKLLYLNGTIGYSFIPTVALTNLSMITLSGGLGLQLPLIANINFKLSANVGYSLGIYKGAIGGTPLIRAGARMLYNFTPSFSMGIGASYSNSFSMYEGISVYLGAAFNIGAAKGRSKLKFNDVKINPVFPVLYQYYDQHPLGEVKIKNGENGTINDVRISFYVKRYMDKPKLCSHIIRISKNQEVKVPLFALFSDNILEITEGTKVNAEIIVEYNYLGTDMKTSTSETLQLYHRNAMTWDDNRKAASFVTAKDPEILKFSKNVAGLVRQSSNKAFNEKFREAVAIFQALKLYDINYVIDPTTPYSQLSQNKFSLDFLQFPIQTMTYKAGDCDDLAILYSALLEAIGIETAFITVPGHIYMAFNSGLTKDEARKMFTNTNNLLYIDGVAWVPVEITMVQKGFLKAWQFGAKEWRENIKEKTAKLYSIHDAWETYPPVGITDRNAKISLPDSRLISSAYVSEFNKLVNTEISARVERLKEKIKRKGSPKLINTLGILYARYGLYDKAKGEFEKAIRFNYNPALINLGNIYYLKGNFKEALKLFQRANHNKPNNIKALIGLAKTNYELENYDAVSKLFTAIKKIDPSVAEHISYLVSGTEKTERATDISKRQEVIWDEE